VLPHRSQVTDAGIASEKVFSLPQVMHTSDTTPIGPPRSMLRSD
jgi:hypothetical protein